MNLLSVFEMKEINHWSSLQYLNIISSKPYAAKISVLHVVILKLYCSCLLVFLSVDAKLKKPVNVRSVFGRRDDVCCWHAAYSFKRTVCPITLQTNFGLVLHSNGDIAYFSVSPEVDKNQPKKANSTNLVCPYEEYVGVTCTHIPNSSA
jgi:hypothetical protein